MPGATIALAALRIGVINLPHQERRRNRAVVAMSALGLPFVFIDGVRDQPRHFGCSQSHLKAIETLRGSGPFLVLEDDAVPTPQYQPTVTPPDGIDLLYLGHSPYGHARHLPGGGTPEIVETDPTGFLRVHSMLAAHAILYLTDAGAGAVAQSIRASIGGPQKERHDIGLCDLQQRQRVLATPFPYFAQSPDVQGAAKQDRRSEDQMFVATPRREADVVSGSTGPLTVVRAAGGGLQFMPAGQGL